MVNTKIKQYQLFSSNINLLLLYDSIADSLLGINNNEFDEAIQDFEYYINNAVLSFLINDPSKMDEFADEMTVYYGPSIDIANEVVYDAYLNIINSNVIKTITRWDNAIANSCEHLCVNIKLFDPKWSKDTYFIAFNLKE